MKATHTPGPWALDCRTAGTGRTILAEDQSRYVAVAIVPSSAETDANAALIAAAPDLLAASSLLLDWIDGQIKAGVLPKGLDFPAARAAIAKAEGRA